MHGPPLARQRTNKSLGSEIDRCRNVCRSFAVLAGRAWPTWKWPTCASASAITVAILAQGTHWAVAVTQAYLLPGIARSHEAPAVSGRCFSRAAATRATAKADSTLRCSQAVPHPSTNRALCRLTSEVKRDPVHSTRYGRQRHWILASSMPGGSVQVFRVRVLATLPRAVGVGALFGTNGQGSPSPKAPKQQNNSKS